MRRSLTLALAMCLLAAPAAAMPPGEDGEALRGAATALAELRIEDAAVAIHRLARTYPADSDVRFERALLRFYQGDYRGAVADLELAGDQPGLRAPEDRAELAGLIRSTHETTREYVVTRSDDGRYEVRHAPGPDAVLVPYAVEAMRAADRAISQDLGVRLPGPIRLEIYPTAASLADVSSLTVQDIATTGTIALCKWDRLMISSPRALLRGYPWMDTIGHELVHLFLSRASRDHAPVWFQEGVAKFLERRWRGGPPAARLDPASANLLARAVADGELLSFDSLHPSIARLPSNEAAALAFAQVATFIERFHEEHGADHLRAAIRRMAAGEDAREALAAEADVPFSRLESDWRAALRLRPPPQDDAPDLMRPQLREPGQNDRDASDVEAQARRFLRLGDLLYDRGRFAAAAVEYGRAQEQAPDDRVVASRYALAALEGQRPRDAVDALERMRERYPEHAPTWAISGAAWAALGDIEHARTALREAIRINPFDPRPHCELANMAESDAEQARASSACRRLGGQ